MQGNSPFEHDAVDRFYDRQHREILARLDPAAATTAHSGRGARGFLLTGLATAAVVVLGAALLLRPSPAPAPFEPVVGPAALATGGLPLDAYGSWPTAFEVEAEAPGAATVAWLFDLAEQDGFGPSSLEEEASDTEFLAAYGTWEEAAEEVVAKDAT